jgi:hypothetical protein
MMVLVYPVSQCTKFHAAEYVLSFCIWSCVTYIKLFRDGSDSECVINIVTVFEKCGQNHENN